MLLKISVIPCASMMTDGKTLGEKSVRCILEQANLLQPIMIGKKLNFNVYIALVSF